MTDQNLVRIFIGDRIEYESERIALKTIFESLSEQKRPALILVNISVGDRQLDFVVVQEDSVTVIEVKGYFRPVSGGQNGEWLMKLATGSSKRLRNPYRQTLGAVNALRDSMREFDSVEPPYPAGMLVFVPRIPSSSDIDSTGFKISAIDLADLPYALKNRSKSPWSLSKWLEFAEHHHFTEVNSLEAAYDPEFYRAEQVLKLYNEELHKNYAPACRDLIESVYKNGLSDFTVIDLQRLLIEKKGSLSIEGPSGCGKTMLAAYLSTYIAENGGCCLFLQAKYFLGSIKDLLDREAGMLGIPSAVCLLKAARKLNSSITFIVDGYNECSTQHKLTLTRSLSALANKFDAAVLVTSQEQIERSELLALQRIIVSAPSFEEKLAIASNTIGEKPPLHLEELLRRVSSGLEAKMVAEVGSQFKGTNLFQLVDQFARKRLGHHAAEGIRALARMARQMAEEITFSISIRDLDRLTDSEKIQFDAIEATKKTGFLTQQTDRVAFSHEMFLNAFAAEGLNRNCGRSADKILQILSEPRHQQRKALIISSIDNEMLVDEILSKVADNEIITACLKNECGDLAFDWATAKYNLLAQRVVTEAEKVEFHLQPNENFHAVVFAPESLAPWTPFELAIIDSIAYVVDQTKHLDLVMEAIAKLDDQIDKEWKRLWPQAKQQGLRSLRSPMFSAAYVLKHPQSPAISRICTDLLAFTSREFDFSDIENVLKDRVSNEQLSDGQLCLILRMLHRAPECGLWVAPTITDIIKNRWKSAPYHLRIEIMDIASFCWKAVDADRLALISVVSDLFDNENILQNTMLFETLGSLGALDEEAEKHELDVRTEIDELLNHPMNEYSCVAAYRAYCSQFDHPLSNAYYNVISALDVSHRKAFLQMAARAALTDEYPSCVDLLIVQLMKFGDSNLASLIEPWLRLPTKETGFIDERIAIFIVAHIAYGQLGIELRKSDLSVEDSAAKAVILCAEILYYLNRKDLSKEIRFKFCKPLLKAVKDDVRVSAAALGQFEQNCISQELTNNEGEVCNSLIKEFPEWSAEVCRNAMIHSEDQKGYFKFSDAKRILEFSIKVLAQHGNSQDLNYLKKNFANHAELGATAIEAIKQLEKKQSSC